MAIGKPFPGCDLSPFSLWGSPGQMVAYPLYQMGPPRAELCLPHRWRTLPLSDPTSLSLRCSFLIHWLSCRRSGPLIPFPRPWIYACC